MKKEDVITKLIKELWEVDFVSPADLDRVTKVMDIAAAAENEECAKVVEGFNSRLNLAVVANAIRARKK